MFTMAKKQKSNNLPQMLHVLVEAIQVWISRQQQ